MIQTINTAQTKFGCGALIINDKEEVLLLKRHDAHPTEPGYWTRPGGKVEVGEIPEDCVKREIKEEVGVYIEILRLLNTVNIVDSKNVHCQTYGYLAKIIGGTPKNREPNKHIDMQLFSIYNLPKKLNKYTQASIDVYLASK